MTRAVLIGGTGFIGRWLGRALRARGIETLSLSRTRPAGFEGSWLGADATDPESIADALAPGDTVIHMVHSSIPADAGDDDVREERENVRPYEQLLGAALPRLPALWVYYSSGGQVYGEQKRLPIPEWVEPFPTTAYGRAKLAMERLTKTMTGPAGIPWIVLRPGNPYGPLQELTNRHGAVPALLRAARDGTPFKLYGGGTTVRDYIFIEDAAAAAATLICRIRGVNSEEYPTEPADWSSPAVQRVFNLGTGRGTSLLEMIAWAEEVTGKRIALIPQPIRSSDVSINVLDPAALVAATGVSPRVDLLKGLRRTWEELDR